MPWYVTFGAVPQSTLISAWSSCLEKKIWLLRLYGACRSFSPLNFGLLTSRKEVGMSFITITFRQAQCDIIIPHIPTHFSSLKSPSSTHLTTFPWIYEPSSWLNQTSPQRWPWASALNLAIVCCERDITRMSPITRIDIEILNALLTIWFYPTLLTLLHVDTYEGRL